MDKKLLGRWGEGKAAEYLKRKHYKLIGMNYSCRFGEIDIIAEINGFVVFAEVKLRKNADFAEAREFVDARKRERIISAASIWLAENHSELQPRFDVIEIYAPNGIDSKKLRISHIENAF